MKNNGYLDRVTELLSKNDTDWIVFDKIQPNPINSHVMEGAALAQKEGILAGMSSGGAMTAALHLAKELDTGIIVSIICDRGDRYLSSDLFE